MTVAYLPPMHAGGARPGESLLREALTEGPAYARSRAAGRWHLVRSATDTIDEWAPDVIRRSYHYWCGQFVQGARALLVDVVPPGEPVCGTCYGRREGHDPDRPDLLFTPRIHPPRRCPGSQRRWYRETAWNRGICLACQEPVKLRGFGGPYRGDWGAQVHSPGPGLVDGCDFHGWRELTLAKTHDGHDVVTCICRTREVPRA